jgi:Flp pilus assembly protein TadD
MIWALLLAAASPAPAMPRPSQDRPALDYARLMDEAIDGGRLIQADAMLSQWRASAQPQDRRNIEIATTRLLLEKRRDEAALARFTALGQSGPADCRVDEGQGVALVRLGRFGQAVEPLRRAVAACATRWRAWNALAVAYDHAQSWTLSLAAYERAFQFTDRPAQLLNNFGLSLLKQQQPERAAAIFEQARTLAPDDDRIIANGDTADIMSGRAIRRRPGDSADRWAARLSHAGQVALAKGDPIAARAYLSRAVTEADIFIPEAAATLAAMESAIERDKP